MNVFLLLHLNDFDFDFDLCFSSAAATKQAVQLGSVGESQQRSD
jgi:hypothetical protein